MPKSQRTLTMIKPDGVERGLVGAIIKRFEQKGFRLVAIKMVFASAPTIKEQYSNNNNETYFQELVKYMTRGPVVPMVWEGPNAIKTCEMMHGKPHVLGSIRGDFANDLMENVCHASDGEESAEKDIARWFKPEELITW